MSQDRESVCTWQYLNYRDCVFLCEFQWEKWSGDPLWVPCHLFIWSSRLIFNTLWTVPMSACQRGDNIGGWPPVWVGDMSCNVAPRFCTSSGVFEMHYCSKNWKLSHTQNLNKTPASGKFLVLDPSTLLPPPLKPHVNGEVDEWLIS